MSAANEASTCRGARGLRGLLVVPQPVARDHLEAERRDARLPHLPGRHRRLRVDAFEHVHVGRYGLARVELLPVDELIGANERDSALLPQPSLHERPQDLHEQSLEQLPARLLAHGVEGSVDDVLGRVAP